jgi:hypothetical protein
MRAVYKITNKQNGRCYIGRTNSVFGRFNSHISQLRGGKHSELFQADFNEHGFANFTFEILETGSIEYLKQKEAEYINFFDAYQSGYNNKEEPKFEWDVFLVEDKEDYLKKAFTKITLISDPKIKYICEVAIDAMLPVFDNDLDLMRSNNEILIIPNKFETFRKVPFIYLNKDLD